MLMMEVRCCEWISKCDMRSEFLISYIIMGAIVFPGRDKETRHERTTDLLKISVYRVDRPIVITY